MAINVSGNALVSTNALPVSIANGGTGATNTTQALINLNARNASENVILVSTNISLVKRNTYVLVSAGLSVTLPSSNASGDWINIVIRSAATGCTILRNGSNIMGLAEDLNLDVSNITISMIYIDSTNGWCINQ